MADTHLEHVLAAGSVASLRQILACVFRNTVFDCDSFVLQTGFGASE
jgi:hypothetical protein